MGGAGVRGEEGFGGEDFGGPGAGHGGVGDDHVVFADVHEFCVVARALGVDFGGAEHFVSCRDSVSLIVALEGK